MAWILVLGLAVQSYAVGATGAERSDRELKLKAGARGKLCVDCHEDFSELLAKPHVHTPIAEGDCTGCHNPHTSNHDMLLSAQSGEMCVECHDELVVTENKSAHQVFVEGKCLECHDPHASDHENNLVRSGSELCYECHEALGEKINSNTLEHEPVVDDCLECHDPHVSTESTKLLTEPQPVLCLNCHDEGEAAFKRQHKNYPVEKARCTSCHDPHGSNTAGLVFDNMHEPVGEKKCGKCHQGTDSSDPFALQDSGFELCQGCHYEEVADALNKERVHWPLLDETGCINCHAPHASSQAGLLKEPMLELCGACHQDTIARQERSQTQHEPIAEGKCSECHAPHSSDNLFLAKESSYLLLCESCHEWQLHSTHPIGEKYVDPRNQNVTLQCLSCHRTHGTEYEHFIYYDTTNELCVQCHSEYRR